MKNKEQGGAREMGKKEMKPFTNPSFISTSFLSLIARRYSEYTPPGVYVPEHFIAFKYLEIFIFEL